ncbi:hypothetical protein [Gynuella sunshinyii]|uniref:Uncharacterized protein n=1 Tax=Gynuella sunshinyii YC6258 TaxID=1445510 RepID=A0A0C5V3Q6_9GAMM|nr:hypothetical protein [Gynuella sunshinyii]AJQ94130.1 hypothetical Protein YC6258_02088 [Gynuella sunshinyii YC6258]
MKNTEIIEKVNFQLCSVPDSEGLVLELSNGDEPAFLEVRVDDNDVQWFRFFSSEKHIAITLEDMEKAIEIAKKEVVNTSIDM